MDLSLLSILNREIVVVMQETALSPSSARHGLVGCFHLFAPALRFERFY